MTLFNKPQAIQRINYLASKDIPFIFIVDYKGNSSYIFSINEVDPYECLYDFRGKTNHKYNKSQEFINFSPYASEKTNYNYNKSLTPNKIKWDYNLPSYYDYSKSFEHVKSNILKGNSFLTNLTCKIPLKTNLCLKSIFHNSKAPYKIWVDNKFVCFSPEIFIRIENSIIKSFPMKGTIDANIPNAKSLLLNDPKESAEHATIVDLIRNDISKIASNVNVDSYRYVDLIKTNKGSILQTSSEISGSLPLGFKRDLGSIIFSLLPAGSITGAPKDKTMEIIAESENFDRGFYTGIMGIWENNSLDSAVMIRFIDNEDGNYFFKAGGGITSKSLCIDEYNEIKQKTYVPIY